MKAGLDEDEKIPSVNSTYLRERHIDSADAKWDAVVCDQVDTQLNSFPQRHGHVAVINWVECQISLI